MDTASKSATAWALTNRAELIALTSALECYFQAIDTGNAFEQRTTHTYLVDRYLKAKETIEKGVWNEEPSIN
jgi:hypothetical protein